MKIELTKKDKILIGITVFLYLIGLIFGGWNIPINLVFLAFALTVVRKSQTKRALSTFHLIILVVLVTASLLIKLGFFLQQYNDYKIKKEYEKKLVEEVPPTPSAPIVPTPTIYNCPTTTSKTQNDIGLEKAENELSTYSQVEVIRDGWKEKTSITYLAKEFLPCESFDEKYCQITNKTNREPWIIKYPKEWKLYRIKNRKVIERGEGASYSKEQYDLSDLKFEYRDSNYYLREGITLGGQPIMLSQFQWKNIQKNCEEPYYKSTDNYDYYICPGNTEACMGDTSSGFSYSKKINVINTAYKSFLMVNESADNDPLIYGGYIPSLNFEREEFKGALRIYGMSDNFYSNDEQFISELKKIYMSLRGVK